MYCVFLLHYVSNHNCLYLYLQVYSDLMMHILLHNEHQEHKLEYKEEIHYILLFVMNGLCIFDVPFKSQGMLK